MRLSILYKNNTRFFSLFIDKSKLKLISLDISHFLWILIFDIFGRNVRNDYPFLDIVRFMMIIIQQRFQPIRL